MNLFKNADKNSKNDSQKINNYTLFKYKADKAYAASHAEVLKSGKLFEDKEFDAIDSTVALEENPNKSYKWKRPREIHQNAVFIADGVGRFDVVQGELGNCWLLAATAALSMDKNLFNRIVPSGQEIGNEEYCGMFRFHFWCYGEWQEVVIDDRLPCTGSKLLFMSSASNNEFWSSLLEKAYAKLHGSYGALKGGSTLDAMEDFTGGLAERFYLQKLSETMNRDFFQLLLSCKKRNSLMGCSIESENEKPQSRRPNGLVVAHAYTITDVQELQINNKRTQLIRIRNPWGNYCEWKGAWSDASDEWENVSEDVKIRLEFNSKNDGEFWMCCNDFVQSFTVFEVCHLGPESFGVAGGANTNEKLVWEETAEHGFWRRNVNAGGNHGGSNIKLYATNPQFRIRLVDPDDSDNIEKCSIIVGLMQKNMRKRKLNNYSISYRIYQISEKDFQDQPLNELFFRRTRCSTEYESYMNTREISKRHELPPGYYIIVPSTFNPNEDGEYLLRIYSQKAILSSDVRPINEVSSTIEKQLPVQPEKKKLDREWLNAFLGIAVNNRVTAFEMQEFFNSKLKMDLKSFTDFDIEVCRSILSTIDTNYTGSLELNEFHELWSNLVEYKDVFIKYDTDKKGFFDSFELRSAIMDSGFKVSDNVFNNIALRYAHPKKCVVYFQDFLLLSLRLKSCFSKWNSFTKQDLDSCLITLDQFLQHAMYM